MYLPAHFAVTSPAALTRIVEGHPLGLVVRHDDEGFAADHIPFEYDAGAGDLGCLRGHVARANPLWQRSPTGSAVLVVFQGAQAYISPGWYPSKQEAHRQVPTWNYEVVHVHGRLVIHDDERFLRGLLARLTRRHEAGEKKPWRMGEAAPGFIDDLLGQIVGIEIIIESIVGKAKLSQNKPDRDRLGAAAALEARGEIALARAMRGEAGS